MSNERTFVRSPFRFCGRVLLALGVATLLAGSLRAAPTSRGPTDPANPGTNFVRTGFAWSALSDGTYMPVTVRLPVAPFAPRPVVLVVHGYSASGLDYAWIAEHLASRGFAAALVQMKSSYEPNFEVWATQATAAIDALARANANPWSGLFGELDLTRVAVVGHSYGGTTAIATAARDARVKVVAALEPGAVQAYKPVLLARAAQVKVPLLVLGGELDTICPPAAQCVPIYQAATGTSTKLYVEVAKADHLGFLNFWFGPQSYRPFLETHTIASRYFTAWLETHLLGKADPDGYTDGRTAAADVTGGDLSRFLR